MKESKTTYSYLIEHMQNPSFQKVWDIAFDFVQKLPAKLCEELHDSLNRGVDILDSEPLLQMYIYSYGKMHKAKLFYAFDHLQENVLKYKNVEIVDYGCGQGLATICYHDYLLEHNSGQSIKKITLIEPSEMALSRAELLCTRFYPETEIVVINKPFDNLTKEDLLISDETPTIHLFSNILDVESYDLVHLSELVKEQSLSENEYVITSPLQSPQRIKRLKTFASIIDKNIYFEKYLDKRELQEDKDWTCAVLICSSEVTKEIDTYSDELYREAFSLIESKDRNNPRVNTIFNEVYNIAITGDMKCQNALGALYKLGIGITKNYVEAFSWFLSSAHQVFPPAISNLANCYYLGQGTEVDYVKAVELYEKAIELDYLPSYSHLAVCYIKGYGVKIDIDKGLRLLKFAAEKNDARAQRFLGNCYYNGIGVEKDLSIAISLYKKSSEKNDKLAYCILGECYQKGVGVGVDIPTAIKYYTKAGLLEVKEAIIALIEIFEKEDHKDLFGDEQFDVFVKGGQLGIKEVLKVFTLNCFPIPIKVPQLSKSDSCEKTYDALIKTIEEHNSRDEKQIFVYELSEIHNANFVFDVLKHLLLHTGKSLGFYARYRSKHELKNYQCNVPANSLYPYIHDSNVAFENIMIDYNSIPSNYIIAPVCEESFWEIFLLDNLECFLPKFSHANYDGRIIVLPNVNTEILPEEIKNYIHINNIILKPQIEVVFGSLIRVQCVYYNEWEGLVRWTDYYMFQKLNDENMTVCRLGSISGQTELLYEYDCGIMF